MGFKFQVLFKVLQTLKEPNKGYHQAFFFLSFSKSYYKVTPLAEMLVKRLSKKYSHNTSAFFQEFSTVPKDVFYCLWVVTGVTPS